VAGARWPSLAALVDSSLLRVTPDGGTSRFSLHPLLREFAREMLAADPSAQKSAYARHADYFARHLSRSGDKRIDAKSMLDSIERELEDCRIAWRWATDVRSCEHIRLAAAPMTRFFESRGRVAEGLVLFERALQSLDAREPAHLPALTECAVAMASLQVVRGVSVAAEATARRALAWARASGQRELRTNAIKLIGKSLFEQGRGEEARRYLDATLARARAEGDDDDTVSALTQLAACDQVLGNYEAAEAACREAVAFRRAAGEPLALTLSLHRLGDLLRSMDRYEPALPIFEEGLRLAEVNGFDRYRPIFLVELGLTHCELGHSSEARHDTERALASAHDLGMTKIELIALEVLARLATEEGDTASSRQWLANAMRIEQATANVPMQLETASVYAEALAAEGERRRTAAIWTYITTHAKADDQNRRRALDLLARLKLEQDLLDEARRAAERLDLESLAIEVLNGASKPAAKAQSPRPAYVGNGRRLTARRRARGRSSPG
jgi:tetratricopeptide (TPR) repeat protein